MQIKYVEAKLWMWGDDMTFFREKLYKFTERSIKINEQIPQSHRIQNQYKWRKWCASSYCLNPSRVFFLISVELFLRNESSKRKSYQRTLQLLQLHLVVSSHLEATDLTGKNIVRGWKDDSPVKSTCYFSRWPRFDCQHPHGNSQLFVTLILVNSMHFSGLSWHCTHVAHWQTCKQNTYTCQIKVSEVFLKETKRLKVLWWCFTLWFRNNSRTKEKPNTHKKIYIRTLWAPWRYLIYKSHFLRYLDAFYMELKGLMCVKQTCH